MLVPDTALVIHFWPQMRSMPLRRSIECAVRLGSGNMLCGKPLEAASSVNEHLP